ncbi:Zdhhc3 [Symbiodinium sp. CCMP2592]|nr:Zdhhc3 [Symbiodinium sp. CCMP2592]
MSSDCILQSCPPDDQVHGGSWNPVRAGADDQAEDARAVRELYLLGMPGHTIQREYNVIPTKRNWNPVRAGAADHAEDAQAVRERYLLEMPGYLIQRKYNVIPAWRDEQPAGMCDCMHPRKKGEEEQTDLTSLMQTLGNHDNSEDQVGLDPQVVGMNPNHDQVGEGNAVFRQVYLQWLRDRFAHEGRADLCEPLSREELELVREIEQACFQDFQQVLQECPSLELSSVEEGGRDTRRQLAALRQEIAETFVNLETRNELPGLRAELHHQLATRGNYAFASYVVAQLGDMHPRLPAIGDRTTCHPEGRLWVQWVLMGLWQHHCHSMVDHSPLRAGPASERGDRSRSRRARGSTEVDDGEDDGSSLFSLRFLLVAQTVRQGTSFDEPFYPGHGPHWYTNAIERGCELMNRGYNDGDLDRALWKAMLDYQDDRFTTEAGFYLGGIARAMDRHRQGRGGHPWAPPRPFAPPAVVEMDSWVRDTIAAVRRHWFWMICPTAVRNRNLEASMEEDEYPDPLCCATLYEEEDSEAERSRLSRSRTPQRGDMRKRLGLRKSRSDAQGSGATLEEGEVVTLMDTDEITKYQKCPPKIEGANEGNIDHCIFEATSMPYHYDHKATDYGQSLYSQGIGQRRRGLSEAEGVDAWRFLLGLDVENFEQDIPVVGDGRPLLPVHCSNMIEETVGHYDDNDRAIMTVAFLRFLRMLMAEVSMAFERGVRIAEARVSEEVLVDVPVDPAGEPDTSSYMQRSVTSMLRQQPAPTSSGTWHQALQGLQVALDRMDVTTRRANVEGLRSRLDRDAGVPQAQRDQLVAVLIAMSDGEDGPGGVGDVCWQVKWWSFLFPGPDMSNRPASSTDAVHFDAAGHAPTLDELLEDEQEMRAGQAERRDRELREQVEHETREAEYLEYQEGLLDAPTKVTENTNNRRLTAAEFKAWEDWQWYDIMTENAPKRMRKTLAVTVSGRLSPQGGWLSRSMRLPLPRDGETSRVVVDLAVVNEECPDDVETVVLEPGVGSPLAAGNPVDPHKSTMDNADTLPYDATAMTQVSAADSQEQLQGLEFTDYEKLYAGWKAGRLTDDHVKDVGGEALLDLMQAQRALDFEDTQMDFMPNEVAAVAPKADGPFGDLGDSISQGQRQGFAVNPDSLTQAGCNPLCNIADFLKEAGVSPETASVANHETRMAVGWDNWGEAMLSFLEQRFNKEIIHLADTSRVSGGAIYGEATEAIRATVHENWPFSQQDFMDRGYGFEDYVRIAQGQDPGAVWLNDEPDVERISAEIRVLVTDRWCAVAVCLARVSVVHLPAFAVEKELRAAWA